MPSCKEINCGHPGRLWNGWLEGIEGGTGLGASIIFRCHEGMLLIGNSSSLHALYLTFPKGEWFCFPKRNSNDFNGGPARRAAASGVRFPVRISG
nr:unnamed protein product [Callosobruchus analis]